MTNNCLWGAHRVPHRQPALMRGGLAAEYWRAVSQLHLGGVMGRGVTHDLVAGANGRRREHGRPVSQLHLARVMGRGVTHDLVAHNGPPGIHDLIHGMSPVYGKSPFLVPSSLKVLGLH